ncbi:hypothetical protein HQ945_08430 [Phyllobacterium sp. BT25]|uniref:Uncharacterized protein n=1 Tax=Phyllobacterium pellucidum TaxID=2740464 RepID=A0A849VTA9_9HYPH|nr:hypothetical protein [Phyllobacterium pellucidum]NTS31280.1 hypothetical protein [Phyllobacterium pellucidum]
MTAEQFRELKQLILNLAVRVEAIELHLRRQDEIADHRHSQLYQWCAPDNYKIKVERIAGTLDVGIPDDVRKFFPKN